MITILILALIESLYDFAVWYGLYKEQSGHRLEWLFRVLKSLFDFIVIPVIAYHFFDVQLSTLAAFFVAKWFHLCDSFYNVFSWIVTGKMVTGWGFWRWWTPWGLLRCSWWGFCVLPGYTELDYETEFGHWTPEGQERLYLNYSDYTEYGFWKGMLTTEEAWIQTALGLAIAAIMLQIMG